MTILSFLQLIAISWLSFKTYKLRKESEENTVDNEYIVWAIIAFGFFFLAFDDLVKIHENLDDMFHTILMLQETNFTDRIDDIIVILYGLIGIGVLTYYRDELMKYREVLPVIILGFVLFFSMAALDIVTNSFDILTILFDQGAVAGIYKALSFAEDSFKIFAEGAFLLAFYMVWYKTKSTVELLPVDL